MSAKGSSAFGAGLSFGGALALSAAGKASADFCVPLAAGARTPGTDVGVPSDAGAECWTLGAGCVAEAAFAGGTIVPIGDARASVFAGAAAGSVFVGPTVCSAFGVVTACSGFAGRGAGATVGWAGGLPGALGSAVSLGRAAGVRFAEAPAGMIGGGIDGRGWTERGCPGRSGRGGGELAGAGRAGSAACASAGDAGAVSRGAGLGAGAAPCACAGALGA